MVFITMNLKKEWFNKIKNGQKTYETHKEEILEAIGNDAGVYTYDPDRAWLTFQQGGKAFQVEEKDELFYRTILYNYLWRRAHEWFTKRIDA